MDDKSGFSTLSLKIGSNSSEGGINIGSDGDYRYTLVIESVNGR